MGPPSVSQVNPLAEAIHLIRLRRNGGLTPRWVSKWQAQPALLSPRLRLLPPVVQSHRNIILFCENNFLEPLLLFG